MVHHHCDVGTVIMQADRFILRGQKNRVLVNAVLVQFSITVDGKHFPLASVTLYSALPLTITLLPWSGNR